ncbi:hypothetical protein ATK78_2896 [Pedobacter metabolipauper]|uniref:Uncharacterized protein n=2 Tax=Pedobacter metabolipauper TaxID=425513 RepID=A0A4V3D0Z4_9SPHI|nr:hypothetical protein ATK78_2896 [Pedobacter metabolipauper]
MKYMAIAACIILGVFMIISELKRPNKAFLTARILASIVAILSLYYMLFPVQYQADQKSIHEINLLTRGTAKDSITGIKGNSYTTEQEIANTARSEKVKFIADLPYFLKSNPRINALKVYGYGLSKDQLKGLDNYQMSFHPAPDPVGVVSCSWNWKLASTEKLQLEGTYHNDSTEPVKLLLRGFGANLDSVRINPKEYSRFTLHDQPKQSGRAVYELIAMRGSDTVAREFVPIQTSEVLPSSVLILSSYPDFEYKFLKNWLFENKFAVTMRSRISKDKFSTDFLNTSKSNMERINPAVLKKTDLLVVDEEELNALSASEYNAISRAAESGMGILIRLGDPGLKTKTALVNGFSVYRLPDEKSKQLNMHFPGQQPAFGVLPIEQRSFLKPRPNDQMLVTDLSGKGLVNSHLYGSGKVLLSSVPATYNWLLAGKEQDYNRFWSALFSKALKKLSKTESWLMIPAFPVPGQKTRFIVDQDQKDKVPLIEINDHRLSPAQNIELPFKWDAISWPQKQGWNIITINNKPDYFYVYHPGNWNAAINHQNRKITTEFVSNTRTVKAGSADFENTVSKSVSLWWFLLLFLCSAGFLWYESRILSAKF